MNNLHWLWNSIRPYYDCVLGTLYTNGIEWNINGTDRILLSPHLHAISENHEPLAWKTIMSEAKSGDTVADVGASTGLYTLALAKRVGESGRVVAFEPDPLNFALLKEHITLNKVTDRVSLINTAVGAKEGYVNFCFGKGAFSHVSNTSGPDTCLVECVLLDQVFSNKRLDILKIDVEGYEEKVLKGAINLLKDKSRSPRLIFIELHPWAWQKGEVGTSTESLIFLLNRCNYKFLSLDAQPIKQIESMSEILARKNDS